MSRQLTRAIKIKIASNSRLDFGLPHGPSFTFVTELIACDPGISAECATVFRGNDPIFAGHFPGNPLVPGVILTEALAQTAGIAATAGYPEKAQPFFLLFRNSKHEILRRRPAGTTHCFTRRKNRRNGGAVAVQSRCSRERQVRLGRRIGFDQNASAAWRFKPLTLCRDNGSRPDRCRLQIINRAPIAGCDERGGSFPWAFTRGIIDHFFPSPEEIANAQSPGDLAPIRRALHQLCKPVVGIGVFEPLSPKMSWITEHNLPALKQERMIINRIGGESGFYR